MGYIYFEQQVALHVRFLRESGLIVDQLIIDASDFVRTPARGACGRGEYAYKTVSRSLNNGLTGLLTWCRSTKGTITTYKTYGYPSEATTAAQTTCQNAVLAAGKTVQSTPSMDLDKIHKFWQLSSPTGRSDYLERKRVGAYRIRFRDNQYGRVAIIPVVDLHDRLCGYQILNADGSKVFAKGIRLQGAFHRLSELMDGVAIGIAESYVTAATCLELIGMPMVTAFTSHNLELLVKLLHDHYPRSLLLLFADNDTHLRENKGVNSALKAVAYLGGSGIVVSPSFPEGQSGREYSDWNDLVRIMGRDKAREQMMAKLRAGDDPRLLQYISC